jgi:hypothetical protein
MSFVVYLQNNALRRELLAQPFLVLDWSRRAVLAQPTIVLTSSVRFAYYLLYVIVKSNIIGVPDTFNQQ